MAQLTRHIRVNELRPNEALQEFAKQIEHAVKDGYSVSDGVKYHAVFLDVCDYTITMVKTQEVRSTTGFTCGTLANFLEKEKAEIPPMTWKEDNQAEVKIFATLPEKEVEAPPAPETAAPKALEESSSIDIQNTALEELSSLSKKEDLLAFAALHNVVLPEDMRVVTAIKKYIKNALTPA